jgi:hypothetical protein
MELEIIKNYLSIDESLNLPEFRIANRKIQNRNLDNMADGVTERFNSEPKNENFIKKVVILTANEFESPSTERFYVPKEI